MLVSLSHLTSELSDKIQEIAACSFGVQFLRVPESAPRPQAEKPKTCGASTASESRVEFQIEAGEIHSRVTFRVTSIDESRFTLSATVPNSSEGWLQRLAVTTQALIEREIELCQRDASIDDYASQISRDFEELVWTRELASHIQNTDLRTPVSALVKKIFPTLLDTIQAEQIIHLQHLQPTPLTAPVDPVPETQCLLIGEQILSYEQAEELIAKFGERARQQPVVVNNCAGMQISGLNQFILVPIHTQCDEFGWILAVNRSRHFDGSSLDSWGGCFDFHQFEFGSFEAGLMKSAASFLASHTKNVVLYQEQENLLFGIVRTLINTIDAKDHYTSGHSDRVATYSRRIAQALKFSARESEEIYLAGLLHDIGKVGIPDHVLQKQSALTPEEFELLKQHPVIGYNLLRHLHQIDYVLPGVRHHHEAIDGSGYPDGLVGENIPIQARIIAVADAYDAMTSDRPYRSGMPHEQACEILSRNVGPQWDPNILAVFLKLNTFPVKLTSTEVEETVSRFSEISQRITVPLVSSHST